MKVRNRNRVPKKIVILEDDEMFDSVAVLIEDELERSGPEVAARYVDKFYGDHPRVREEKQRVLMCLGLPDAREERIIVVSCPCPECGHHPAVA